MKIKKIEVENFRLLKNFSMDLEEELSLVILDNGGWHLYNFAKMFLGTASPSVMDRTQKIFYVCCTL